MELPDGQQSLADMLGQDQPTGGGQLRQTLSRLVPRQRQPEQAAATARTPYGFYPVYDTELPGDPPLAGEVVVRIAAPGRPAPGEAMTFAVDLNRMLLFDRAGDRIRLE